MKPRVITLANFTITRFAGSAGFHRAAEKRRSGIDGPSMRFSKGQRIVAKWDNALALSSLDSNRPYPIIATVIGKSRRPGMIRLLRDGCKSAERFAEDGWQALTEPQPQSEGD